MIFLFLFLLNLIVMCICYKVTMAYSITENSKIHLLHLIIPFSKKYSFIFYFIINLTMITPILYKSILLQNSIFLIIILNLLQCLSYIDIKCFRLPNNIMIVSIILSILFNVIFIGYKPILFGLIGFIFLFLLAIVKLGGLGGGDIKLAFLLGTIIDIDLYGLLISYALGFVFGGLVNYFLLSNKLLDRKDYMPYGPFLFVGFWLMILYGKEIMSYLF